MQKYKFYFEMEGKNGEKVNKRTKKNGFIYRKQQTGETETGDECNKNSELAKLEQQTSDRKNSGLSEPNSERKPVCQVFK
ncbi:hypothetical protein V7T09_06840 [Segatella copri]|uniref:hypothetical protein n=1 Tax=Segatella copri TaxID=165179 RepID=UPI001C47A032|nr:hypothetical protein [Segatella copri]MBW0021303.1 hypothetical protein [Segatella copri]MBW0036969.1 hypothetical protein [Segatella copri]